MKHYLYKFGIILFAVITLAFANTALAATLNVNVVRETYQVGDQFNADIKIDSQDVGVNAAQATIKFSPAILEVVSVDKTGSAFNFWIQDPAFNNSTGEITFIGGASSGLVGKSLQVVRVVFKAKGLGQSDIIFTDGAVTASDGSGTNVLSAMNKASVNIVSTAVTGTAGIQTIERTPIISNTSPIKPGIAVLLYPDQTRWYNISSKFSASWQLPNDVSAVATALNRSPVFDPASSEGVFNNQSFSALSDGIWYLHVRFCNNMGCGETSHYRLAIDTVPPSPFEIKFSDGLASNNPTPVATCPANDQLSGIDRYYIQIDTNEMVTSATRAYTLPPQKPGKHTIKMGAQDKAGNKVENTAQFEILPIDSPKIFSVSTPVFVGEGGLIVNGTALDEVSVILEVKDAKDNSIYSFTTNADEKGNWAMKIDSPLKKGIYHIFATAQDSRGALSLAVKSESISVQERPVMVIWGFGITYGGMVIILLIILIGGYIIGWYSNSLITRQRKRKILISERDVFASFNVLKRDVEQAIRNWDDGKIESHELTQIEFLLKHVDENIEKLQKYIINGIKDIGRK